ncbi:MAG: 30S ribosomal protein S4 [Patescibacteria group bacterium]
MMISTRKCRLCRREKTKLFLKGSRCFSPKCPLDRKGAVPPGMHGIKSGARLSYYGQQLREKQKLKRFYGISETQLRNYFKKAQTLKGPTGDNLLSLIETRLDNVVYRLGLVPSRATARQLTVHGYVLVNGRKAMVPSRQLKVGETVSISQKASKMKKVQEVLVKKDLELPSWLEKKALVGKVASLPVREEITLDVNEYLIIEFYLR